MHVHTHAYTHSHARTHARTLAHTDARTRTHTGVRTHAYRTSSSATADAQRETRLRFTLRSIHEVRCFGALACRNTDRPTVGLVLKYPTREYRSALDVSTTVP
jgi:hypothetical protein